MAEDTISWGNKAANVQLSSDGLTLQGTTGGFGSARATIGRDTGKRAFEIEIISAGGSSRYGLGDATFNLSSYLGVHSSALGVWSLSITPLNGPFTKHGADSAPPQAAGTRYQVLVDFDAKKGWLRQNGLYRTAGADPATGAGYDFSFTYVGKLYPAASSYSPGDVMKLHTKAADIVAPLPAGFVSWASEDGTTPPPPPPPPTGNAGIGLLGDSITWYMDQAPASSEGLLGFAPTFNFGSPSATTTVMLSQVPALLDQKPKAVMVLGGVNDYPLGVPRQTTVDNIVAIVEACMAAGVVPFVQGILPVAATYSLYGGAAVMNAEIAARNALVHEALLPLKGGQWLDWGGTLAPGDWLSDSIHLSPSGFAKMSAELAPYINLYR